MNAIKKGWALAALFACLGAVAQTPVNTTPSRGTLDEAARSGCDGVSVVVQRCADDPRDAKPAPKAADPLTRSRAATKAAFDRRDRRSQAEAASGAKPADGGSPGDPQRLQSVTVTGTSTETPTLEEILQRALNPTQSAVPGPNGTVSRYAPDGTRYDCIAKCVGPACCATVRALPNPARESNSIGR